MNTPSPEILEAARFYAPNSERLQRAFVFGYLNGGPARGMSLWERDAAEVGRRRAARSNYGRPTITAADRAALANVESPDVSPSLDR